MDNYCNGEKKDCCKGKEKQADIQQTYYDLGFNSGRKTIKDEIKKVIDSGMTDSVIISWLKGFIS
jgi:hypothetical protein